MRRTAHVGLLLLALFVGVVMAHAQTRLTQGTAEMRGVVKSANTLPEEIQYWEIRDQDGVSILVAGQKDLPLIAALRNAKGRRVVLTIERDDSASDEAAAWVMPRETADTPVARR